MDFQLSPEIVIISIFQLYRRPTRWLQQAMRCRGYLCRYKRRRRRTRRHRLWRRCQRSRQSSKPKQSSDISSTHDSIAMAFSVAPNLQFPRHLTRSQKLHLYWHLTRSQIRHLSRHLTPPLLLPLMRHRHIARHLTRYPSTVSKGASMIPETP